MYTYDIKYAQMILLPLTKIQGKLEFPLKNIVIFMLSVDKPLSQLHGCILYINRREKQ